LTVPEAIELMLRRINTRKQFVGGTFAGWAGGTTGNILMYQRDANQAIALWREKHDMQGLVQLASTLQAYGKLTDEDYEKIMEALVTQINGG